MNSFLHPINTTNFSNYKPGDAKSALEETEALARKRQKEILKIPSAERRWDNAAKPFNDSSDEFDSICGYIEHLQSALGDDWDEADSLAEEMYAAFSAEQAASKEVYQLYLDVLNNDPGLTSQQERMLTEVVESYRRQGIDLPTSELERLTVIRNRISKLSNQFAKNSVKQNDAAGMAVDDSSDLAGLDDDFIKGCEKAAENHDSRYWVQYTAPNYLEVIGKCSVLETRRRFAEVAATKDKGPNEAIVEELLSLRAEMASLLSFDNYMDLAIADRMAKDSSTVKDFLSEISAKYEPHAVKDAEELLDFARQLEGDDSLLLGSHDLSPASYYARLLRKDKFGVDESELEEYMDVGTVLDVMFSSISTIYSIEIKEADCSDIWHEDVRVYDIIDKDGKNLARVWCDWYARKGKRSGAWMNSFYTAPRDKGVAEPHLGLVMANLPQPRGDKPALLSIRDVETIWHEFGHFLHLTFSNTELVEQSMMATKWDFVEAPSQINENFVWQPEVMGRYLKHYETGVSPDPEVVQAAIESRNFMVSALNWRQIMLATTDCHLHTDYKPGSGAVKYSRENKLKYQLGAIMVEDDFWLLSFNHIFSGGYSAAYYSYKWADVIQADLYSRFAKEGPLNPVVGQDYRDKVLARGNEVDPDVLVRDFLGRPYNQESLLKLQGLL